MAYIEIGKAIAEIDKGNLLVGNNAEWAKEIIRRTPTADVVPRAEVAREIFEEIDKYLKPQEPPVVAMNYFDFINLKLKYTGEQT